jgi:hypothetical protein
MAIELMLAQGNDEQNIAFAVLSLARVFYQLKTGRMAGMEQAGQFALQALPVDWCAMIAEALRIHRRQQLGSPTAHENWALGAEAFVRYLHDCSDEKRTVTLQSAAT